MFTLNREKPLGYYIHEKTNPNGKLLAQLSSLTPRTDATDGKSDYSAIIPGKDNLLQGGYGFYNKVYARRKG